MYSPEVISRDISSNLMYSSSNSSNINGFKHGFVDGEFYKNREILGSSSDLFQNQNQQQQQQQQNNGLMRYRSAPSSYFATHLDGIGNNTTTNNSSNSNTAGDSSESDSIFSALMNNCSNHQHQGLQIPSSSSSSGSLKMEMNEVQSNPQLHYNINGTNGLISVANNNNMVQIGGNYQAAVSAGGGTVVGSYSLPLPLLPVVGMENPQQMRINNNNDQNRSNLVRQSSSPAGFFSSSGFNLMREIGKFNNNGETCTSSSSNNSTSLNFASAPSSSSSRYMPSIAEHGTETSCPDNHETAMAAAAAAYNNNNSSTSSYPTEHWNENPASGFSILKRNRDGDFKIFSEFNPLDSSSSQDGGETRNNSHTLTHHLSLPKTAGEMAVIEKYLQFQQDSIPCKIRAKRGCATHPRSIAERMRRTRISERMKKLQELFPNMDKQTNTADMLDLAVEYIKDLQNEVQTLTETRAKCKCLSSNKSTPSPNGKA